MLMHTKNDGSVGKPDFDGGVRRGVTGGSRAFDVCAGNADALCAVLQWRLHEPKVTHMVSGPLCVTDSLGSFHALPDDDLLVCNVPLEVRQASGLHAQARKARVQYLDCRGRTTGHVQSQLQGPSSSAAMVCTSLLVNHLLGGKYGGWALVGAYGSTVTMGADTQAMRLGCSDSEREYLRRLGESISYNAEVLHPRHIYLEPANLYARLARYEDPLDFLQAEALADDLDGVRQSDLQKALAWRPYWKDAHASVYVLPDVDWASRVARQLKLRLASLDPDRAIAVLSPAEAGGFRVAVQPGIKVRKSATAKKWLIEHLPQNEVDNFVGAFSASGWGGLRSPVFRAWH